MRTRATWSTATSSRATSSSPRTARCSAISGSPKPLTRPQPGTPRGSPGREAWSGRRAICRPSKRRAAKSLRGPTCTPRAWSYTRRSHGVAGPCSSPRPRTGLACRGASRGCCAGPSNSTPSVAGRTRGSFAARCGAPAYGRTAGTRSASRSAARCWGSRSGWGCCGPDRRPLPFKSVCRSRVRRPGSRPGFQIPWRAVSRGASTATPISPYAAPPGWLACGNGAGGLRVRLTSTVEELDAIEVQGQVQQWRVLVDTLADRVFGSLLGSRGLLDRSLPAAVLPKTRAGLLAFQKAERLFADARWGEARSAYAAAAALDTACWLCYLRHAEVGRWLDLEDDPADNIHDLAHVDAFPLHYQRLIRAQQLPVAARLDSLDALTRRWKDFLFGQFRRGDELLHRGPLVGRSRREALAPFEEVLKFQPAFGPALEHLAWVHIVEGDSARATAALAGRERLGNPSDPPSFATLALVELAYAWRFLPSAEAVRRTDDLVRQAKRVGVTQLDAGARYLPAFGVPHGALAFAERLLHEPGFERSASIARVLALVGLGRPDTAVALARRLAGRFPDLAIFADELSAAMLVFDSDSARLAVELPAVRARLNGDVDQPGPADRRRRAV